MEILGKVCDRYNWVSHGWCQMANHYHLIVETAEANLSEGMRHLNGAYTQFINRTHNKNGHVFQGRYHAVLVQRESHLVELARYVVLNPVRARMVHDVADWPWSSYAAMVGRESPPKWLRTESLLRQFGSDHPTAIANYANFVRAGTESASPWDALKGQIYLGCDDFVQKMRSLCEGHALPEVPHAQHRPEPLELADYEALSPCRAEAMAEAYASGSYTMAAIAAHFGVHYATVSRAVARRMGCHKGTGGMS